MFQFRLQTVLRLRMAERDQRRSELAKASRAEEVLLAEERSLIDQQATAVTRARELKSPGAADVDALLQTHRYEVVLVGAAASTCRSKSHKFSRKRNVAAWP